MRIEEKIRVTKSRVKLRGEEKRGRKESEREKREVEEGKGRSGV